MQSITIMLGAVLCTMGLIIIYLETETRALWKHIWVILLGAGGGICLTLLITEPVQVPDLFEGGILGLLTAQVIFILYLAAKNLWGTQKVTAYYDDGTPPKYYITGDKHRNFEKIKEFCWDMGTRRKDVLIILGDAGFNYYEDNRDDKLKREMSELNITLFCLHGNKEKRPQNISTYGVRTFCGGRVYYEPKYPNIYFAMDGELYTFEGKQYMVVGGAHSVDKMRCLKEDKPFWGDEMPSDAVKAKVERALEAHGNRIYGMLTHTCPIDCLPTEAFISTRQNAVFKRRLRKAKLKKQFKPDINRSTEEWLGVLEEKITYSVWFCGHYHVDKQIDKVYMLYQEIRPLHMPEIGDC